MAVALSGSDAVPEDIKTLVLGRLRERGPCCGCTCCCGSRLVPGFREFARHVGATVRVLRDY